MNQSNFVNLYRLGARLYEKLIGVAAERYGLTNMEFAILLFLSSCPHLRRANSLIEEFGLTKSHVSMAIKTLEEKHLIEKKSDPEDKRAAILVLSPLASEIAEEGKAIQKSYEEMVLRGISEEEKRSADLIFSKMESNIKENLKYGN